MIDKIDINTFSENNEIEICYNENESKSLDIHRIEKSKYPKYKESARDPFSIILKGNKEVFFNQGYYDFNYKDIVGLELFVTPVLAAEGDDDNFYYQIVFS